MSAKKATQLGTFGGIKYLDQTGPRDPDREELNEPKRFKPADTLNKMLTEFLGDLGPWITDYQFPVKVSGLRDRDITFDRCYPLKKLLVHRFFTHRNIDKPDQALADDIAEYSEFAQQASYTFLAVIDDKIECDVMNRIAQELKAA